MQMPARPSVYPFNEKETERQNIRAQEAPLLILDAHPRFELLPLLNATSPAADGGGALMQLADMLWALASLSSAEPTGINPGPLFFVSVCFWLSWRQSLSKSSVPLLSPSLCGWSCCHEGRARLPRHHVALRLLFAYQLMNRLLLNSRSLCCSTRHHLVLYLFPAAGKRSCHSKHKHPATVTGSEVTRGV